MQNNYRARLFKGYIINAPWTFSAVWGVVKNFIEESTAMKIHITSKSKDENMKSHINLNQVEAKYGGQKEDLNEFWPPRPADGPFGVEGDDYSKILHPHN